MQLRTSPAAPRVFISHRHRDKAIADKLREWIEKTTLREVDVFQSSHPQTGLPVGAPISRSILDQLWHTKVLVLVYTHPEQDWSWCMYECGVATDAESPETRVVVLECAGIVPALFSDQVNVKAGNRDSVEQFAVQFLTDPSFFPNLGRPIAARLSPDGPEIKSAAGELFSALSGAIPDHFRTSSEPWPALPYMRLAMPADQSPPTLGGTTVSMPRPREAIDKACVVSFADKALCHAFGLAKIPAGTPLGSLPDVLAASNRDDVAWFETLRAQLDAASKGRLPDVDWRNPPTIRPRPGSLPLSPLVSFVTTIPHEGTTYFDVYFLPLAPARQQRWLLPVAALLVVSAGCAAGFALLRCGLV